MHGVLGRKLGLLFVVVDPMDECLDQRVVDLAKAVISVT
jgi:hypothetical protein